MTVQDGLNTKLLIGIWLYGMKSTPAISLQYSGISAFFGIPSDLYECEWKHELIF